MERRGISHHKENVQITQQMRDQLFDFELDFNSNLRCVPMFIRMQLDKIGVKLDLRAWAKFSNSDKETFLNHPSGPEFKNTVEQLVVARTGKFPDQLPISDTFSWEESSPPEALVEKASHEGVSLEKWEELNDLQKFSLVKLSRPERKNRGFIPACREFGLFEDKTHE